jgi:hypothetical protein
MIPDRIALFSNAADIDPIIGARTFLMMKDARKLALSKPGR